MDIKKKYKKIYLIVVILSLVLSPIVSIQMHNVIGEKHSMVSGIVGTFVMLVNALALLHDMIKNKETDRKFGILKREGNRWLDTDGKWNSDYNLVISDRIQRFYNEGGEDLGYYFGSRTSMLMTVIMAMGGFIPFIGDKFFEVGFEATYFIPLLGWTCYVIIRKAILG